MAAGIGLEKLTEKVIDFGKSLITDSVEAFEKSERAGRQLAAVLESTGRSAEITKDWVMKLSESLASNSQFTKGEMLSMETLLLQYDRLGKDVLPIASQAIVDYAARMNSDPVNAARTLGMALQEPEQGIGRLRSVGVKFSEDQVKVIESLAKTGQTAEAQRKILEQLQKQYGGSGAANIDLFDKLHKALDATILSVQKSIGKLIVDAIEPYASKLIPIVELIGKLVSGEKNLNTEISNLSKSFPALGTVIDTIIKKYDEFKKNIDALVKWLTAEWKKHKDEILALMNAILPIIGDIWNKVFQIIQIVFGLIWELIQNYGTSIKVFWDTWGSTIIAITKGIFEMIGNVIKLALDLVIGLLNIFVDIFKGNWSKLWNDVKKLFSDIIEDIKGILKGFFDWASGIINGILGAISKIGSAASKGSGGGKAWATGGFASGVALVVEEGPELVELPAGSFVHNASQTRNMGGGGNNIEVNIYNPSVRKDSDIQEIVRQVKRALGRENELSRLAAI